ncbi:MAG: c-type cytochrome [Gammaproteobacteria bacterium]
MSARLRAGARVAAAAACAAAAVATAGPRDTLTFHRDPGRSGWAPLESELTRAAVTDPRFGLRWESPQLDFWEGSPPRLYASPLYVDRARIPMGDRSERVLSVIIAASSNGFVYAINASDLTGVGAGAILWRRHLGAPCRFEPVLLDGIPTGVLATPVIDLVRKRVYVTSCVRERGWQAFALDLGSGELASGWPVALDEAVFRQPGVHRNAGTGAQGAPRRHDTRVQRGALNLSPDGSRLYLTFGESATGWLVAVDTAAARVTSAFATVAEPHHSSGGIWGAGGAAVDDDGSVFVATGTGFSGFVDQPRDWVQSVLMLADTQEGWELRGTYTPFNYCQTATMDVDLGSGGVALVPTLDSTTTATPRLLVLGGKQGNAYLLDRSRLPGRLDRRQPCSEDASSDASLLGPGLQPQFGKRGPLNVFGPYSERDAALDMARGRSVPAYFRDERRRSYVFMTGSTKAGAGDSASMPPSLARLEIVIAPGAAAHLRIDQVEKTRALENPGSPVVTSHGGLEAIVWVLDENARRSALLAGPDPPSPLLYAFDALTLAQLWRSAPGELHPSGKYNEPAFARGRVFTGTDRIQAFGLPQEAIDGGQVYEGHCAQCHDHPQGRIPPRELIAMRPYESIVEALTGGVMREQGDALSLAEIDAVAKYLH